MNRISNNADDGIRSRQDPAIGESSVRVRENPATIVGFFAIGILNVVNTIPVRLPLYIQPGQLAELCFKKQHTDNIHFGTRHGASGGIAHGTGEEHGFALGTGLGKRHTGREFWRVFSVEGPGFTAIGASLSRTTIRNGKPRSATSSYVWLGMVNLVDESAQTETVAE